MVLRTVIGVCESASLSGCVVNRAVPMPVQWMRTRPGREMNERGPRWGYETVLRHEREREHAEESRVITTRQVRQTRSQVHIQQH